MFQNFNRLDKIIIIVLMITVLLVVSLMYIQMHNSKQNITRVITQVSYLTVKNVGSTIVLPNQPVYIQGSDEQNYPTITYAKEPYCTCGQYAGVAVEEIPIGAYGKILKIKR